MQLATLGPMSRTTLSVPTRVRDIFAAVAASRNTTMLALLDELARRLQREEAMRQATESYKRLAREEPKPSPSIAPKAGTGTS